MPKSRKCSDRVIKRLQLHDQFLAEAMEGLKDVLKQKKRLMIRHLRTAFNELKETYDEVCSGDSEDEQLVATQALLGLIGYCHVFDHLVKWHTRRRI